MNGSGNRRTTRGVRREGGGGNGNRLWNREKRKEEISNCWPVGEGVDKAELRVWMQRKAADFRTGWPGTPQISKGH